MTIKQNVGRAIKIKDSIQVSSMIHSARPTVVSLFSLELCYFDKWGREDGRTDKKCENSDHYLP